MPSLQIIALSAATTALAIAGVLTARRASQNKEARIYLILIFALFAGIASLPLTIAFAKPLYTFHLPAILPMLLAVPIALYYYVAARTTENKTQAFKQRDAILPGLGLLVAFGYWVLPASSKKTMLIEGELPTGFLPALLAGSTFALLFIWIILSIAYLGATVRKLRRFRTRLKNFYSNTSTHELRWIDWLMALLVGLWAAAALSLFTENIGLKPIPSPAIVFTLTSAFLLFLIAFISTPSPNEDQAKPDPLPGQETDIPADKYARSALSKDQSKQLSERIESAMQKDELYLAPNLSLQKLSRHVRAVPNMVSQTLNDDLGSTFYDYVAHWRINAAKPLILDGNKSILTISIEVGFNSRSTFYKAFKRETGLTPKAYRASRASKSILE